MNKIKNTQRGSTLLSVVFSAALISAIVIGSYSGLNRVKEASEFNSTGSSLCRLAAQNVLSSIRSSGGATKVFKSPINNSSISLSSGAWHSGSNTYNPDGVENENGISTDLNEIRWPNQRVVDWSGGLPAESNAPKAIYSYMNSLAAVYFSNGDICSDRDGVLLSTLNVDDWGPAAKLENFEVEAAIRIRPYNLLDGSYSCSIGSGQWPRPFAQIEPPLAVQDNIIELGNYDPNIGFEVEASIKLIRPQARNLASFNVDENTSDDVYDCSLTEKFSYDVQDEAVPIPNVTRSGGNLNVTIPSNRYSLGSYLLCRAESHIIPALSRGNAIARRPRAVLGPGEGWRTCDQVTNICGQNLGPVYINDDHTEVEISAPSVANCAYEYEAITVDAAGNVSLIASVSGFEGTTSPVPPTGSDRDGSPGPSFSVDGVNYETQAAAQVAADLSGLPMQPIPSPAANPRDVEFNSMNSAREAAFSSYNSATASANTANAAAASATSLNSGMTSANTSSSLASAASSAAASAATAASAASAASAAANAAASSAAAATASANSFAGPGQPGYATAQQTAKEAQAVADWAAQEAAEALAAAQAAQQAAMELAQKEQEARDREEAEDDDDD